VLAAGCTLCDSLWNIKDIILYKLSEQDIGACITVIKSIDQAGSDHLFFGKKIIEPVK
jgi:hypothetical protein